MSFTNIDSLIKMSIDKDIFQIIIEDDMSQRGVDYNESFNKMNTMWEAMKDSVRKYDRTIMSNSGLSGTDAGKIKDYRENNDTLAGDFIMKVMETAVAVAESNACMKRIVAAPTAGSCGVLPAVLVPYYNEKQCDDAQCIKALYVAAAIGEVIAHRASISGAQCGCQAEIGAASAMSACALTYIRGGNALQIMNAGAMALKNLLGLACDPVGGYVEVPCVKRNVIGAVNAITSSEMALAGVTSKIPFDEVIDAMGEIGEKMDSSLKETGKGGLAATPTGMLYGMH